MTDPGDTAITVPMVMPPALERWTRNLVGDDQFHQLRDRPLLVVALASQRAERSGASVEHSILEAWVIFINSKRGELLESEKVLRGLLQDGTGEAQSILRLLNGR